MLAVCPSSICFIDKFTLKIKQNIRDFQKKKEKKTHLFGDFINQVIKKKADSAIKIMASAMMRIKRNKKKKLFSSLMINAIAYNIRQLLLLI